MNKKREVIEQPMLFKLDKTENIKAKPFLKWAGGKTQLLPVIEQTLPNKVVRDKFTYIEPFVGSGAVLFWMLNNFPNLEKAIINDINEDLINCYRVIATNPTELISILKTYQQQFHALQDNEEKKKEYYYLKRDLYNSRKTNIVTQASLFIFLNRTCFNGLYRVNRNNLFNVPMGSYKTPTICDEKNILAVSRALERVEIMCGDYEKTLEKADQNSFFYFDPPYKPLSNTSVFNSYSKDEFDDSEQIRLRDFCTILERKGCNWLLSNSDVKAGNNDNFFDEIYAEYFIARVRARRSINANAEKRGELNELIILNY